ncbi:Hypothetical predicted protein [Olea europaea subsp. europaea]|uniref:Agenet domain-containing protein n=1 Tax=Olea europaea subsp. europaea TaxID=158383 RepID=A0A8S0VL08_OLEEU|nr:Hypothetical predicted protein [Olea europaea subsp. europaea]
MVKGSALPFKVGQLAEARTFEKGYLGAWFRCKIRKIGSRKGHIGQVFVEYLDYEEKEWVKLYEVPIHCSGKLKKEQRILMLRPPYPPVYHENQMPNVSDISEVMVILDDAWKVGNLVDGLDTGCYWSGRIIELSGDGKAKIKSPPPPMGEGLTYEFSLEDLRPSLDWSPEYGWTVLTLGGETDLPCARLVKPGDQGHETEAGKVKAASSPNISPSSCSSVKTLEDSEDKGNGTRELHELYLRNTVPTKVMDARETNFILAGGGSSTRKTHSSDTNSTSHIRAILAEPTTEVAEGHPHQLKKYRASGGMTLNSMRSHKLEAGILDLEELVNKVKWL